MCIHLPRDEDTEPELLEGKYSKAPQEIS